MSANDVQLSDLNIQMLYHVSKFFDSQLRDLSPLIFGKFPSVSLRNLWIYHDISCWYIHWILPRQEDWNQSKIEPGKYEIIHNRTVKQYKFSKLNENYRVCENDFLTKTNNRIVLNWMKLHWVNRLQIDTHSMREYLKNI